jgi:lipopolysaccharide/colanic/teichoic acid biosynthesis glycosyltransferase
MRKTQWTLVASGAGSQQHDGRAGIYPPEVFQALLHHERSRADREGSEFSLVVFDVPKTSLNGQVAKLVVHTVREQMRSIDEVGWLDSKRIGILLPATKSEGGRKFARRVCESIPDPAYQAPWMMYSYPDHWMPDGEEKNGNDAQQFDGLVANIFCQRIPVWKRCIDIVGSSILIVFFSPLFLLLIAYIQIVSPGKVLFKQKRVGYRGKQFTFIKFRSMHEDNKSDNHRRYLKELISSGKPMEKLDDTRDPRIILGGKIIRKACLDELPQLFNVLRGDMSLVGPRPCIPYEAAEYLRWHTHRFDILPGMTGLWQVSGKNKLSFEQMIRLDIAYAKRMSPLLDLKILLRTVPTILGMIFEAGLRRLGGKRAEPPAENLLESDEERSAGNA